MNILRKIPHIQLLRNSALNYLIRKGKLCKFSVLLHKIHEHTSYKRTAGTVLTTGKVDEHRIELLAEFERCTSFYRFIQESF